MKVIIFLLSVSVAMATETPKQQADSFYRNYEFKKALAAWSELFEKSPTNWLYAKQVADLQFLLEGRAKAFETLRTFLPQKPEAAKKILELAEIFVSEEAQTHYLQALSKTQIKEWNSALSPVTQAAAIEPTNLKILSLKYDIEKKMELHAQALETLKAIHKIDTVTPKTIERLAESLIFHGKFSEAKALLETLDPIRTSNRAKMALAVSLWELNKKEEAQELLLEITQNKRAELAHHPVTLWMMYRLALDETGDSKETKSAHKVFLKASAEEDKVLVDGWDPYRISHYRTILAK